VGDVVRAIADLMLSGEAHGQVFNIGSTEEVTIAQLARRVRAATDSASEIVTVPYDEAYEEGFEDMLRRIPDITRIHELLGWTPTSDLDATLADVVDHHRREGLELPAGELA
jgi:UDP-glucose 4-epimerase